MDDFQHRKNTRRRIYSRTSVVVLALITVFLLRGAFEVYKKQNESKKALAEAQTELAAAKAHQTELEENQSLLSSQAGVEREIREKYSVAKPGEEVAIIVDPTTGTSTPPAPHTSVWTKIGNWFRDIF